MRGGRPRPVDATGRVDERISQRPSLTRECPGARELPASEARREHRRIGREALGLEGGDDRRLVER